MLKEVQKEKEKNTDEVLLEKLQQKTAEDAQKLLNLLKTFENFNPYYQKIILQELQSIYNDSSNVSKESLMSNRDFYSVAEAAEQLQVTQRTIHNYLNAGLLEGEKQRNRWRIFRESLEDLKKQKNV